VATLTVFGAIVMLLAMGGAAAVARARLRPAGTPIVCAY
jgi:hypothetical protein